MIADGQGVLKGIRALLKDVAGTRRQHGIPATFHAFAETWMAVISYLRRDDVAALLTNAKWKDRTVWSTSRTRSFSRLIGGEANTFIWFCLDGVRGRRRSEDIGAPTSVADFCVQACKAAGGPVTDAVSICCPFTVPSLLAAIKKAIVDLQLPRHLANAIASASIPWVGGQATREKLLMTTTDTTIDRTLTGSSITLHKTTTKRARHGKRHTVTLASIAETDKHSNDIDFDDDNEEADPSDLSGAGEQEYTEAGSLLDGQHSQEESTAGHNGIEAHDFSQDSDEEDGEIDFGNSDTEPLPKRLRPHQTAAKGPTRPPVHCLRSDEGISWNTNVKVSPWPKLNHHTLSTPVRCTFFDRGFCQYGGRCHFNHTPTDGRLCKHFVKGRCAFGANCNFEHVKTQPKQIRILSRAEPVDNFDFGPADTTAEEEPETSGDEAYMFGSH
jgi:hypothetical protein